MDVFLRALSKATERLKYFSPSYLSMQEAIDREIIEEMRERYGNGVVVLPKKNHVRV